MRPKFVFALSLSVLFVLGVLFFLKHVTTKPELLADSGPKTTASPIIPPPAKPGRIQVASNAMRVASSPMTPEEHQAAIGAEIDRLQDLSANNDPASLTAILSDLTSPDKKVRLAAIEAAKQFGSADAIPVLKADAATTQDPEEQTAMLEAADILSLPDMTMAGSGAGTPATPEQIQAAQQKYAAMQARRLAHSGSGQNQRPQPGAPASSSGGAPGN